MSDAATTTKTKKLAVIDTIKDGVSLGVKNIGPIIVNALLYVLTCWIPYLNIGTTIGLSVGIVSKVSLSVGIVSKVSKGETISNTEIFDPKYRKYMGEYFLTYGLMFAGISIGLVFFIIPGYVLCFAWSLALLLVIDKGKNPTEALSLSNNLTYGYKAKMFCISLLPGLAFGIVFGILTAIFSQIPFILFILTLAVCVCMIFVMIGIQASIYRQLTEEKPEEEQVPAEQAPAEQVKEEQV